MSALKLGTLIRCAMLIVISAPVVSAQADTSGVPRTVDSTIVPGGGAPSATYRADSAGVPFAIQALRSLGYLTLSPIATFLGFPTIGYTVHHEDGVSYSGIAIITNVGLSRRSGMRYIFFPLRMTLEGAWFPDYRPHIQLRASIMYDEPIIRLDNDATQWVAVGAGMGLATSPAGISPFAEGWCGMVSNMNPYPYVNLTWQIGVRGRAGYDLGARTKWYEAAFVMTTTYGL